jgi:thioredoxin-dependent peroxiredoxin
MRWISNCLVRTAYEVRLNVWIFPFKFWDCCVPEFERENVIRTVGESSKDDTPGCTTEACSFRDANREMQQRGIVVLGISKDSLSSHKQFADKYQLPYPLLADTDATGAQEYGAYGEKNMYGKKYMGVNRSIFLIDKEGIVRRVWHKVKPEGHASEVLEAVDALKL